MSKILIVAALSLGLSSGVAAAPSSPAPAPVTLADSPRSLGYQAIADGDFASAEQMIRSSELLPVDDPARLLNLAYIYMRTGRTADALRCYEAVQASDEHFMVELANGMTMDSRDVARMAIARMPTQVAQR